MTSDPGPAALSLNIWAVTGSTREAGGGQAHHRHGKAVR